MDGFRTVRAFAEASFTEKRSEFIGYITPAADEEQAVSFINEIRSRHRKATHNVYAYILRNGNISRYSDDGEPQGTAGVPVLEVLRKEGLTDVCCVATRYFGGILLGGGGLVRAYSHTAKIAVDAADIMEMHPAYPVTVTADYSLYGKITYIIPEYEAKLTDSIFTDSVTLKFLVKEHLCEKFVEKLTDLSNGACAVEIGKQDFYDFSA